MESDNYIYKYPFWIDKNVNYKYYYIIIILSYWFMIFSFTYNKSLKSHTRKYSIMSLKLSYLP